MPALVCTNYSNDIVYSSQRQKMIIKQIYCYADLFLLHSTAPARLIYIHIIRCRAQSCLGEGHCEAK